MNKWLRIVFLVGLLIGGGSFCYLLYRSHNVLDEADVQATLAPAFQLAGRVTKHADRLLSKMTFTTKEDERAFGEMMVCEYEYGESPYFDTKDKDLAYLRSLCASLVSHASLSFDYKIFIDHSYTPNAYALPGGIIFVTKGLLKTLTSEAQLVSVLAHEMGHVELGHCADMVKFQILSKKINMPIGAALLDFLNRLALNHSFSKTQENEADEFGFTLLKQTMYDSRECAQAFKKLLADEGDHVKKNVIRDYFSTHPYTALRYNKFFSLAERWWFLNQHEKRYVGRKNLQKRKAYQDPGFDDEWIGYDQDSVNASTGRNRAARSAG